jgi:NAD(P)-dependent dehydrogenase (short-subunit alcohol dehydrogenase family)
VRVSTLDQNEKRQLEGQAPARVFTDKASGRDTTRPQPTELLRFARDGDTVDFAPYCASKFAEYALVQAVTRGLAGHGITCNAFAPGVVDTPLWHKLDLDLMELGDTSAPGQAFAEFSGSILVGHPGAPEDVPGTALYLASVDSDYMTGQVVMIDGGMVLV